MDAIARQTVAPSVATPSIAVQNVAPPVAKETVTALFAFNAEMPSDMSLQVCVCLFFHLEIWVNIMPRTILNIQ